MVPLDRFHCTLIKGISNVVVFLDDLPFGPEERRITRIDNSHRGLRTSTPASTSKASPPNTNGDSSSINSTVNRNINGMTSKLCHLNGTQAGSSSNGVGGLSHSTTIDSSAQGMEMGHGPSEIFESPLQVWTSEGGIASINHSTLTTTR